MFSKEKLIAYIQLMRLDRPIGTLLLLWPTLWALFLSVKGIPPFSILMIFILGVIFMRAAKIFFMVLLACSLVLVLFLNVYAIALSFIGALLTLIYPFMKRYTHLPQLFLGMAFGWSIPMAYGATIGQLPLECWILFIANLAWTVAYDTQYAMVDRDDDLRIGVKSTAILFAQYDNKIITLLQLITLGLLCWLGNLNHFHVSYFLMLGVATLFFVYQCRLIKHRKREDCFKAFLNNNYFGMMVFIAILCGLFIH